MKTILLVIMWILIGVIGFAAFMFVLSFILSLFISKEKEYEKKSNFYWKLLQFDTALTFLYARIHVHVTGKEKLPEGRYLIVENHRSKFDPIITWHVFKDQTPSCISKSENFSIPIFGRVIRRCLFLAIDRDNPFKARETVDRAAELIKNDECSVAVWPEGTRSKNKQLLPFHNGMFKIAKEAGVPIVVVAIDGTENISKNFPLHRTDISFDIIDVLDADYVISHHTHEIGEHVADDIIEHLPDATPIHPVATTMIHGEKVS